MKVKLAAYKKELIENAQAISLQTYTTELWKPVSSDIDDNWRLSFEGIIRILKLNYQNPRAMKCFVFYDIENNRIRLKLAKYLLEKGCQRIQKSVYLANIDKRIFTQICDTLSELEQVLSENDSIFIVPVGEYNLSSMHMVGQDVNMSLADQANM